MDNMDNMINEKEIVNDEKEVEALNAEIEEDEKIVEELNAKIEEYEKQIENYKVKKVELENTLSDLDNKNSIEDISDSTKEKIGEVAGKVKEKIGEITLQIDDLNVKIKNISETLMPPIPDIPDILDIPAIPAIPEIPDISSISAAPAVPVMPVMPVFSAPEIKFNSAVLEKESKIQEFEDKIREYSTKMEESERRIDEYNNHMDERINMLEERKNRLEETIENIDEKMDGDINEATRNRLEEMRDEVQERIDELCDKIDELCDKKGDDEDRIRDEIDSYNDKIDELNERIDELNEEIEEINDNEDVDEDIISEIKNLPGFSDLDDIIPEANEQRYLSNSDYSDYSDYSDEKVEIKQEKAKNKIKRKIKKDRIYNINFCEEAVIDSCCSYHTNRGEEERPEYIIDDDPDLKTKWCAADGKKHIAYIPHPHWIIIDLGEPKSFNYVKILKASEGRHDSGHTERDMSAWRIEVSNDKENWKEFNRETNDKSSVYEKMFDIQTGRYVRLLIDAAEKDPKNVNGHARIYNLTFEMIDENNLRRTNIMKNSRVDSCCHQNSKGESAKNLLIDDDREKWCATDGHSEQIPQPHWIIVDLLEPKTFNHLRMIKASEGKEDKGHKERDMSAWRFEVSGDKESWKEFNCETNDKSSIYIKTFEPQTGRYIRLFVDAGEGDPNNRKADARIYDLRIEMVEIIGENIKQSEVTFDDIIAIAPFAKKETLDKLIDKLIETDNFGKIKELGKFLSDDALDKLVAKAFDKSDFNMIIALAPFVSKESRDNIIDNLDVDADFEKIKALAPFVSKEALARCITSGGKLDMKRLRTLAPFLGSAWIDEIISKML